MAEKKKRKHVRFPMRFKTMILVIVFGLVLVETAMVYFTLVSSSSNEKAFKQDATNLSGIVAKTVDANAFVTLKEEVKAIVDASSTHPTSEEWGSDAWNAYTAQFDAIGKSALFLEVRDYLRDIASAYSGELNCIYLTYVDPVREFAIYVVDSAPEEDACPPGCIDRLYDFNRSIIQDPSIGFPGYISNTPEYGYLVVGGKPIYLNNEVVGYAMVDISMDKARATMAGNIVALFAYMMSSTLVICLLTMLVVHFWLIRPIKTVIDVAKSYDSLDPAKTHEKFSSLDLSNNDEISDLADSIKQLENDVYTKIDELTAANKELIDSQRETREMRQLANTDALTGLNNKIAYLNEVGRLNDIIAKGEPLEFGIAMIDLNDLKVINDTLGHEKGDIALVNLANIISTIFARSRVYRFGGDEFVVLVRGSEYLNSRTLIDDFNAKISSLSQNSLLPKEERTSAAIGYATYKAGSDKEVEDVFNRADEAMYKRKRMMKRAAK